MSDRHHRSNSYDRTHYGPGGVPDASYSSQSRHSQGGLASAYHHQQVPQGQYNGMPSGQYYPSQHTPQGMNYRQVGLPGAPTSAYNTPPYYPTGTTHGMPVHTGHSTSHQQHFMPTPSQLVDSRHHTSSPSHGRRSSMGGSSASYHPGVPANPAPERHYCRKCPNSFSRAYDLKRHMESSHSDTTHPCRVCGRNFSRPDSLKRHRDSGNCQPPSA